MNQSLKSVKILAAAAFTGTMLIGAPSWADDTTTTEPTVTGVTYTTDTALNEAMKTKANAAPTLDYLKENNPEINGTVATFTYSDDTTNEYNYSYTDNYTVTTGSGYHYDNVEEQDQNSVTFWDVNKTTGEMTPTYYNVQLNKTEYGTGDNVKYYEPTSDYTTRSLYQPVETPSGDGSTITVRGDDTPNIVINDKGATLGEINSVFNENTNTYYSSAINNYGTIGTVAGAFIKNTGALDSLYIGGGAIFNSTDSTITNVTADFIGNSFIGSSAHGGAIFNWGTIDDITGTFSGNLAYSSSYEARGGAIFNEYIIKNIAGDFINNETVGYGYSYGGAIYNNGNLGNLTGDFIQNTAKVSDASAGEAFGGAVYNYGEIGNITGDFTENASVTTTGDAQGGAISNDNIIGHISGDFTGNYLEGYADTIGAAGGAIYNAETIAEQKDQNAITGNFTNNYIDITGTSATGLGGAIANTGYGIINGIKGEFSGNYVMSNGVESASSTSGSAVSITSYSYAQGGAISNDNIIGHISGDFTGNYLEGYADTICAAGGAIYNAETIGAAGGAIYNAETIAEQKDQNAITGNFTNNYIDITGTSATGLGGAIANTGYCIINGIKGEFSGNYVMSNGVESASSTSGSAVSITSYSYAQGGAIYNGNGTRASMISKISGSFTDNHVEAKTTAQGGAIYNAGTICGVNADKYIFVATGTFTMTTETGETVDVYFAAPEGVSDRNYDIIDTENTLDTNIQKALDSGYKIIAMDYSENLNPEIHQLYEEYAAMDYNPEIQQLYEEYAALGYMSTEQPPLDALNLSEDDYAKTLGIESDFTGNYALSEGGEAQGGAVYNGGTITFINGNFTNNYAKGNMAAQGGAVYNSGGTIGDITGDFTGNSASSDSSISAGGAIYNNAQSGATSELGNITGDFTGNSVSNGNNAAYGGAIYNHAGEYGQSDSTAKIGDISGSFTGNEAESGGAIYNDANAYISSDLIATIGNITGDFINNTAKTSGGAIYNHTYYGNSTATIGNITGNFTGNNVVSTSEGIDSTANGGAIYNYGASSEGQAKIGDIKGKFNGNYVQGVNAYGGAIYNYANTDGEAHAIIGDITGDFTDNYAKSESGEAKGGAIWTNSSMTLAADNSTSIIKGNYVQVGDGEKDYQAIWVDSDTATMTFKAQNNGTITMYDKIDGTAGYGLELTGDDTGTINLYNDINNSNVNATNNVKVNFANNELHDYNVNMVESSTDTVRYGIDVDLDNEKADTITTANQSSGVVTLETINFVNSSVKEGEYLVQVLKTQTADLQLALADNLTQNNGMIYSYESKVVNGLTSDVNWQDTFGTYTNVKNAYGTVALATKDTKNDSLGITITSVTEDKQEAIDGDTLKLWAEQEAETTTDPDTGEKITDRNFNFDSADNTYKVSDDLGNPTDGTLIINGKTDDDGNHSTIDLNGNKGFDLTNDTNLNIKDTTLTDSTNDGTQGKPTVVTVDNENATVTLDNSTVDGNIDSTVVYKLDIKDDTTVKGDVGKADVKVAADSTATFDYSNKTTEDHSMNSINTTDDTSNIKAVLDIDGENKTSDTITVSEKSSGTITIDEINWINHELKPDSEYKIQILHQTDDSNVELAVKDGLLSDEEGLITTKETKESTVTPDVKWNDTVETYTKVTDTYGKVGLTETEKPNDSIGVNVTQTIESEKDRQTAENTMKEWGEQTTPTDENGNQTVRNFNFDNPTDTYTSKTDLGNPTEGTLNINGKSDDDGNHSTIDLNGNQGFDLTEKTIVNFNDTTIKNGEPIAKVENEEAQINVNNSTLDGDIDSTVKYDMTISGESKITGNVGTADVTVKDGTLTLTNNDHFTNSDVTFDGGNLNLINDNAQNLQAQTFTVNQNMQLDIDADLANVSMDRLPENTTVNNGAMINVNQINLVSDSKGEKTVIPFAYDSFRNSVDYIGPDELSKETQVTTAFAPIYKYGVSYNKDDGMFTFLRGAGNSSNSSEAFNPAVLASPVAAQAGAYTAQTMAFNYAFRHADTYMPLPSADRFAMRNSNKFASTSYENVDLRVDDLHDKGIWVQPYASFENVKLKHGPKVDTITYGTMVGGDSNFKELRNGWGTIFTGYAGYSGSSQSYSGVDTYQNGGLLGATQTFYKKNFFTALTVSAGAMVGESHTMYGHDNFTSLMAGVASKSGYNLEFKEGKFIIQPTMMMSYTFIDTFDYTNAAGVRINSDPLHAIQLNPNIRFIGNTKHGWQPYASVGMVWNIMDDTKVTANDVRLPEMSVKPYVEYGLGIQKRWNDKFTGFGQVMVRNGGRNGVALTAGFRWALGKEGAPIEKTQRTNGNFNASLPTQNRFLSSDINGKNWASSGEKSTFGRPMGSAANIDSERPQNVFGL